MATSRLGDDREELRTRIAHAWTGAAAADPGATIKASGHAGDWARRLSVRQRELSRDGGGGGAVDYELHEFLGAGGMGVVHAARQAALGRTVAVKLMRPDAADDPDKRARFLAEAVVTGNLEHPNIVPVYELGVDDDGTLFYAMKRVEGETWKEAMPKRSLADNLDVLLRVCDAMSFAHARGIVHCDLKPANVMLGSYGETLVLDWGLSVAIAPGGPVAIGRSGAVGGTPAYMPPELAMFDIDRVSPATDVYLLCAVLYEIMTGRPPHAGASAGDCLLAAAMNHIALPLKPVELVDICARGLLTDPRQRWPTVATLADALRDFRGHAESLRLSGRAREHLAAGAASGDYDRLARAVFGFEEARALWTGNALAAAGESEARVAYARAALANADLDLAASLVRESEPLERPLAQQARAAMAQERARGQRQRQWRRLAWSLGEAGAAALVVALVLVVSARANAARERDAAVAAHAGEIQARALAESEAYAARLAVADAWLTAGKRTTARSALESCAPERRGWEWRRLDRRAREPGERETLDLCRRGARLVGACGDAAIVIEDDRLVWRDPSTGRDLRVVAPAPGDAVAPTAGGALLRVGGTARLLGRDGLAVPLAEPRAALAAFAPPGDLVAVADDAGGLRIGATTVRLTGAARGIAWSLDGRWLAVAQADGAVSLHAADGSQRWRVAVDSMPTAVALCERADAVVAVSGDRLTVLDLATGARRLSARAENACSSLVELPDGDRVAVGDVGGKVTVWDARTACALAQFAPGEAPVLVLRVVGEALVAQDADGRVFAWRAR